VHSGFGQVDVPIFGEDNRAPGFYSLTLTGSIRYDDFSDFGDTWNPKVGLTWKPVSWFSLYGNYNTSFNAPGAIDQLGSLRNTVSFFPFNAFVKPGDTPVAVGTIAVLGSQPNLKPQTARNWSIGGDIVAPPFLPGFHAGAAYYNVSYSNVLSIPTLNFASFSNNVQANVTGVSVAQLRAFESFAPNGPSVIEPLIAANQPVYELIDFRSGNYGSLKVSGLDFNAGYRFGTGWGGIDASASGNYQLSRETQTGAAAVVDALATGTPKLTLQGILGTDVGKTFRAQLTLNHVSGYDVVPTAGQTHVGSFDVIDLFFRYNVPGDSWVAKNLSFTINVNNLLDTNPPLYMTSGSQGNGYPQGEFTLGRLIMFGVAKQF
jgi:iron complex outermembrane receptor protein